MTILRVQMHLAVTYHSYSMVSPPAVRLWILLSRFQIFNAGWVRGLRAILNPRQKKTRDYNHIRLLSQFLPVFSSWTKANAASLASSPARPPQSKYLRMLVFLHPASDNRLLSWCQPPHVQVIVAAWNRNNYDAVLHVLQLLRQG